MNSTSLTVYGGFILRSLAALLLFGVLRLFHRRYRKAYLQLWAWSWLASAVYTTTALAGHYLVTHAPQAHGTRLVVVVVSAIAGYLQVALLLAGAGAFSNLWPAQPVARNQVLAAAVLLALVSVWAASLAARSADLRFFWRIALWSLLAGVVFLVAGGEVFRARGTTRAVGPAVLGVALVLSGLEQIHHFVLGMAELWGANFSYEPQLALLDLFLLTAVGLGMVLCLLEEERDVRLQIQFQAILDERNRISREIHDTLAQGFVAISIYLESVDETLSGYPPLAREHLDRARKMVRDSLADARRLVWELRPKSLEHGGLVDALSTAAGQRLGRPVKVEVRGRARPLSDEVESNLLRIGQEALANAASHAGANEVELELAFEADSVRLRVRDDGRGFDTAASGNSRPGHFGLKGMRERAEKLGGRLDLTSVPGRGTEIKVRVPTPEH
jgi:signal transduction histidine kinase